MAVDLVTGMRVFCTVVEAGSFAAAAERLELSRGMATRYVAQLESHFGVRLLNRTTRKLSLTSAGTDSYQRCSQILALVAEAETSAAQTATVPRGTVRVTCPSIFGLRHISVAVADFVRSHPQVQVDLSLNERVVDMVEDGIDLAVRISRRIDPGLVARPLLKSPMVLCASPAYLAENPPPRRPDDLRKHNCLVFPPMNLRSEWAFTRKGATTRVQVAGNLLGNNGMALMAAAIAGLGVIFEPEFVVGEALRRGELVRLLPHWETEEITVYLVWPHRKLLPPKVRALIDFLAQRFGAGLAA